MITVRLVSMQNAMPRREILNPEVKIETPMTSRHLLKKGLPTPAVGPRQWPRLSHLSTVVSMNCLRTALPCSNQTTKYRQ